MTNLEMLQAYRAAVIDLHDLAVQLDRTGSSGTPRGAAGLRLDALPGTNDPVAAAMQASDGIEEMMDRKRTELADLAGGDAPVADRQLPHLYGHSELLPAGLHRRGYRPQAQHEPRADQPDPQRLYRAGRLTWIDAGCHRLTKFGKD